MWCNVINNVIVLCCLVWVLLGIIIDDVHRENCSRAFLLRVTAGAYITVTLTADLPNLRNWEMWWWKPYGCREKQLEQMAQSFTWMKRCSETKTRIQIMFWQWTMLKKSLLFINVWGKNLNLFSKRQCFHY